MDNSAALEALNALAQETRLNVFRLLVQTGPGGLPAGEIAAATGTRQNTMSTHLGILCRAGLATRVRDGRVIRYSADYAGMRGLLTYLLQDCCQGQPAICTPVLEAIEVTC